jgi:hypothetical protein
MTKIQALRRELDDARAENKDLKRELLTLKDLKARALDDAKLKRAFDLRALGDIKLENERLKKAVDEAERSSRTLDEVFNEARDSMFLNLPKYSYLQKSQLSGFDGSPPTGPSNTPKPLNSFVLKNNTLNKKTNLNNINLDKNEMNNENANLDLDLAKALADTKADNEALKLKKKVKILSARLALNDAKNRKEALKTVLDEARIKNEALKKSLNELENALEERIYRELIMIPYRSLQTLFEKCIDIDRTC